MRPSRGGWSTHSVGAQTLPETVLSNAKEMRIDLANLEHLVLSHHHADNAGGLIALRRDLNRTASERFDARAGHSSDPRTAAALEFALKIVERRAQVSDADFAALRLAGFDDEAIVEILAQVALNLFTNYLNVALQVPVDFPAVKLRKSA